jgi:FKBP-type peptidyl-prolyl cis-trans isomerase SlpA
MMTKVIGKNSVVLVDYVIKLADGTTADSTEMQGAPVLIYMGRDHFSEKFETSLQGLKAGDKKKIPLLAKDAFGETDPEMLQVLDRGTFSDVKTLEVGEIIAFEQPGGEEIPGILAKIEKEEVTVDFNHPLCGREVVFHVTVQEVDPEAK